MKSKTMGVMAVGHVATRATQDFISPKIAGVFGGGIGGVSPLTLTNAGLGVVGVYAATRKKLKDTTKLGAAVWGTRLLTDVAYDLVRGMLPTQTPTQTGRYARPMVRVSPSAHSPAYAGMVQID